MVKEKARELVAGDRANCLVALSFSPHHRRKPEILLTDTGFALGCSGAVAAWEIVRARWPRRQRGNEGDEFNLMAWHSRGTASRIPN